MNKEDITAKEMFEELGYEYTECYFEEELDDIYYQKKGKYTPQIQFSLNHKIVKVYREGNKSSSFDMKIYKAINKQIEELGWSNE